MLHSEQKVRRIEKRLSRIAIPAAIRENHLNITSAPVRGYDTNSLEQVS
ncbi:MAG: hypothetical protein JEZ12_12045 [Desulfobacterium sp.]|nr:hypothetical protein [Desulfobacterium sp.]